MCVCVCVCVCVSQMLHLEWSVLACLPATLLYASVKEIKSILFTSFSCYLTILIPMCWRLKFEKLWDCTEFIGTLGHLPLISGHAMAFTCYYIILLINRFYSRYSKLYSATVL